MAPKRVSRILNVTRSNPTNIPQSTPLGSPGYDNARDDIEKVKKLREGSVVKVPSRDFDITNKKYVDTKLLDEYVPYLGAIADVDIGEHRLTAQFLTSNSTATLGGNVALTSGNPNIIIPNSNTVRFNILFGDGSATMQWQKTANAVGKLVTVATSGDLGDNSGNRWVNLFLNNKLDLGTNTISDGQMVGDWNFNGGTLTNSPTLADHPHQNVNASEDVEFNSVKTSLLKSDGSLTLDWGDNAGLNFIENEVLVGSFTSGGEWVWDAATRINGETLITHTGAGPALAIVHTNKTTSSDTFTVNTNISSVTGGGGDVAQFLLEYQAEDNGTTTYRGMNFIIQQKSNFNSGHAIGFQSNIAMNQSFSGDVISASAVVSSINLGGSYSGNLTDAFEFKSNNGIDGNAMGGNITNGYGLFLEDIKNCSGINEAIHTGKGAVNIGDDLFFRDSGSGLPFADIYVQDNTTATTITNSGKVNKVQINIFDTNGESNLMTPDHTNNHITILKAGRYMVNVSMSVESVAGDGDKLGFSLYKNDGTTEFPNVHSHRDFTAGAAKTGSMSFSGIINVDVNDTIEMWGWNEDDTDNFLVEDITLSLVQIGG